MSSPRPEYRQPKPRKPAVEDAPPAAAGGPGWLKGAMAVLVMLVLGFFGMLLLSRTAGFAGLVETRVGKQLGMDFHIGHSALTPTMRMVLTDVRGTVDGHPLEPSVAAKRVVLKWSWWRLLFGGDSPLEELSVEGAQARFAPDSQGVWQPRPFAELSTWCARRIGLDLASVTGAVSLAGLTNEVASVRPPSGELDLLAERHVRISGGSIEWVAATNGVWASASGIELEAATLPVRGRDVTICSYAIGAGGLVGGAPMAAVRGDYAAVDGQEIPLPAAGSGR